MIDEPATETPPRDPDRALAEIAHYFSSRCLHDRHQNCSTRCTTCGAPCRCPCHISTPPGSDAAGDFEARERAYEREERSARG